ncbi:MAG TPA: helix-hairpin-helix domain-containing protein [Bacteroidia bacterium]|nr:helix-hairpin-helix domain-containing protein [Bacteroidia bacterium]HNT81374.1 helix-hairpin-helix domain-containing protein [Bacteroidia bacterium]
MKNTLRNFCIVIFCFISMDVYSQIVTPPGNDDRTEEKIEDAASNSDESVDLTELTEQLQYLSANPINLNTATRDELMQTGLFTEMQAQAIIDYREKTGNFQSLYELQVVDYFSIQDIRDILPYVTVGSTLNVTETLKKMITNGNSRLIVRGQRYLEKQKGFRDGTASDKINPAYPGSPWKLYTQYQYRFKQNLSFNITAEKDQGEEFFKGSQKNGFDFYSAHLAIRDLGIIRTAVIGDYDLLYGQGLTLFTGLSYGKTPDAAAVRKLSRGIKPYTSLNETSMKRGVAVSVGRRNWNADVFYSNKKLDANLDFSEDSLEQEDIFTSFIESGYHRTQSELDNKNTIREQMVGVNGGYRWRNFQIGATAVNVNYDKNLNRATQLYNRFDFSGDAFFKTGIDYNWLYRNINLFGEFSRSENGAIAYVNGAIVSLGSAMTISIVNRNYPRAFNYLYASGFGESSTTRNEKGTYAGLVFRPDRYWTLSGYVDYFTFPWLRFGADAPSKGYEYLGQLTWAPTRQFSVYVRARSKTKEMNTGEAAVADYLVNRTQNNYRLNLSYKISQAVTIHSRVEWVKVNNEESPDESGLMVYQDIIFKPLSSPLSGAVRYGLFDTDSYDSRIYAYENDILYSYSIPAFYNKGYRYYVTLRYKISKQIDVWARFAQTVYTNQKTFGSGLDEINGNKRSEIKLQVRYQF